MASGRSRAEFVRTHREDRNLEAVRILVAVRIRVAVRSLVVRILVVRILVVRILVVRILVARILVAVRIQAVRILVARIQAEASLLRAELVEVAEAQCLLQAEPWVPLLLVVEAEVLAVVAFGQTPAFAATTRTTGSRMRPRRVCARAVPSGSAREGVA